MVGHCQEMIKATSMEDSGSPEGQVPGDDQLQWGKTDCVVMLTWSDWKTEPRSNRYHYATRFARHLPVVFVQPDLDYDGSAFEPTECEGISILHVWRDSGERQSGAIHQALAGRKLMNPLLWIYNPYFEHYIIAAYATYRVYHATEDYFCSESTVGFKDEELKLALRRVLRAVDLVCAVSEQVCQSYRIEAPTEAEFIVLPNGCDFAFLQSAVLRSQKHQADRRKNVILFQGNINPRLDPALTMSLTVELPEWEFRFAGRVDPRFEKDWQLLLSRPNVVYLGSLDAEALAQAMIEATVGIIPFVEGELMFRSLPLKAFEYAACGLPVVTIPIKALEPHPELFLFASGTKDFARKIREAAATRLDPAALRHRYEKASLADYDRTFQRLMEILRNRLSPVVAEHGESLHILVLYDPGSLHISTVIEHVLSFHRFSRHTVHYAAGTRDANIDLALSIYDVLVLHYSVRISLESFLPEGLGRKIAAFAGLKVLFIQDEYETTETARIWMDRLGIHVLFTCVSPQYARIVYPRERYPGMSIVHNLTGYVPDERKIARFRMPLKERKITIGYRGRPLPFWYGDLGREKISIGQEMRRICEERNVTHDIEWTHEARIYGDRWYEFLGSCRATLGTESGSNVFDYDGKIRANIEQALAEDPALSYEEAHRRHIGEQEGRVIMNQISPKVFEAISLKTALVLFEGTYSGVVEPDRHFIPLRKDFSNVEDVLKKLRDDAFLDSLTERAYQDVIASGRFTYQAFIEGFDRHIDSLMHRRRRERVVALSLLDYARDGSAPPSPTEIMSLANLPTTVPLTPDERQRLGDLAVVIRRKSVLAELFPDRRLSGQVKLRSSLRFYPGHGLDHVLQPFPSANYAAALENQRKPHRFDMCFKERVALAQLAVVWESFANRAADFVIEVYLGNAQVHLARVEDNGEQTNVIDMPLCIADRIRVTITRYFGQDRLLIRQVQATTIGSVSSPRRSKVPDYARRFWRLLSTPIRSRLRTH
jgi:glycosyltransferase involved in cell wall biosynthesis